jgi:hypothetical protein
MDTQQAQFNAFYQQFLAWQESQKDQTDGYEFERSFLAFHQQLGQDLLKLALNEPTQQSPKKKSSQVWEHSK